MSANSNSTVHTIRLGTRGSQLALVQSNWVKRQLELAGHTVELIEIKTEGDIKTGPLAQIGGQGLFTKRLQVALLQNEVDLAVHSLKDLPTEDHIELKIGAVPVRENPADALISIKHANFALLPQGARIGTGSVRRAAQLLHSRSDLKIEDIRGNVDTRLKKLESESFDAIVLACAGLNRMGLGERITAEFPTDQVLPAVGQGCLGLEARADDSATLVAIGELNHAPSYAAAMAERAMLRRLFAGCLAPVGARTTVGEHSIELTGVVLSTDGSQRLQATSQSQLPNAASSAMPESLEISNSLGIEVAEKLLAIGADQLLKDVR